MKKSKAEKFTDSISEAINLIVNSQSKNSENSMNSKCEEEITMEDIFGESNDNIKLIDKWVEKQLLGNPEIKQYNKRPYLYKKYHMIDEILRKYGMDFIKNLRLSLPKNLKRNTDEDTFIDCVAWIIWDKKLDLKSILPNMPEFKSMWDKISENGYQE